MRVAGRSELFPLRGLSQNMSPGCPASPPAFSYFLANSPGHSPGTWALWKCPEPGIQWAQRRCPRISISQVSKVMKLSPPSFQG